MAEILAPRLCPLKSPVNHESQPLYPGAQRNVAEICPEQSAQLRFIDIPADNATARPVHMVSNGLKTDTRLACALEAPLFRGLSLGNIRCIACHARELAVPRDQAIYRQGDPRRHIFIVTSGCAKVTRLGPAGDEVILWLKGPGEVMGGLGLDPGSSHESGAQAVQPCRVVYWNSRTMESFAERSLVLQRNAVSILAAALNDVEGRFCELATEKVALRLARTLIRVLGCADRHGGEAGRINLSREELAQMTGTTLYAVSRLLAKWTHGGIIDARRESVLVYDDSRLLAMATENAATAHD